MNVEVKGWMDAARAGDREAFGRLYAAYRGLVYRYVRAYGYDPERAADLTADVFLRALVSVERFSWQGRDPSGWFVTIARNLIFDDAKTARRRHEQLTADYQAADVEGRLRDDVDPVLAVLDAEDKAARLWRIHQLRIAILRLPTNDQREAMLYRHVAGLSVDETAQRMGRRPGVVKALCFRAMAVLDTADLVAAS